MTYSDSLVLVRAECTLSGLYGPVRLCVTICQSRAMLDAELLSTHRRTTTSGAWWRNADACTSRNAVKTKVLTLNALLIGRLATNKS